MDLIVLGEIAALNTVREPYSVDSEVMLRHETIINELNLQAEFPWMGDLTNATNHFDWVESCPAGIRSEYGDGILSVWLGVPVLSLGLVNLDVLWGQNSEESGLDVYFGRAPMPWSGPQPVGPGSDADKTYERIDGELGEGTTVGIGLTREPNRMLLAAGDQFPFAVDEDGVIVAKQPPCIPSLPDELDGMSFSDFTEALAGCADSDVEAGETRKAARVRAISGVDGEAPPFGSQCHITFSGTLPGQEE